MSYNQLKKSADDLAERLDNVTAQRKQAEKQLAEAAGRGDISADEVVKIQAEEAAMTEALKAAKQQLAAAETLRESSDFRQAQKEAAQLQKTINQGIAELIELLAKTGLKARDLVNCHARLKQISRDFSKGLTEAEAGRLQKSKGGNLAFYILANMTGLIQDIKTTRPDLAEKLPKLT